MADEAPRPRLRTAHVIGLVLVAAAGTALVVRYLMAASGAAEQRVEGACLALAPQPMSNAAPPFDLPDLHGKRQKLSELRGKVVLLNFWATWCPPCVEELPSIAGLNRSMSGRQDFTLLTVSVDDTAAVVSKFLGNHKALFGDIPVLMDPSRKVPASYGTTKFPETYLIDRAGQVRYRFVNTRDWSSPAARACIESLL